jgi:uncharacterized membrane protein
VRDLNITSLIAGVVFIVLGVLFLLERLNVLVVSSQYVWPIVLVALGIAIIVGGERRHRGPGVRHIHRDDE